MMNKILKFRDNIAWKLLLRLQEVVLVGCGSLCCLIFLVEVIARYFLKINFRGYDEFVLLFAMWLYFIGGSYAMYKKEHISADMLSLVLKGRTLQVIRLIVSWITFVITVVLAVWGVSFFSYALTRTANTTVWKMPHLWSQASLTVGYILIAFFALIYSTEDTILLIRGGKNASADKKQEEDNE